MGSVLLCRNRQVNEPYYVEELGIMLHSAEELSYYIYHNAVLIEEAFLDERLFRFIGRELAMEELEHKLRKWKEQADLSELLLVILQDIHYYDSDELYTFRETLRQESLKKPAVRMKEKAERLIRDGRLTAADLTLRRLLGSGEPETEEPAFAGKIYYLLGIVNARQYLWQEAAEFMNLAYERLGDEETAKKLYQIRLADPGITLPVMPEPDDQQRFLWESEFRRIQDDAEEKGSAKAVSEWFDKDNIRRAAGLRDLVRNWKDQYRQSVGGL
ncbi:MAG: hypothetical protein IJJ25_14030 [Lachnospiraceae bacterium]|nr:hypothetical protein [Lachnospiraceae bacterium]